jgi:hypothetical protein
MLVGVLFGLAVPIAAHRYFVSLAVVDYQAATQTVEITIHAFPHDLEPALKEAIGPGFRLEAKGSDREVFAYLKRRFGLRDADGRELPLTWVGMEATVDGARLYVEAKVPRDLRGVSVKHALFTDIEPDQVNVVSFRTPGPLTYRDLEFRPGESYKAIEAKAPPGR